MNARNRRSILWRLVAVLLVTQLVVSLLTGWYAFSRVREFHRQSTINELHRVTPIVEDLYAPWLEGADDAPSVESLRTFVDRHGRESNLRITVIRRDGVVLADSESSADQMDNHLGRPEVAEALSRGTGSSIRQSSTTGVWTVYTARLATSDDEEFIVRTARPLSAVEAEARTLWGTIGLAGGASFFVLLVVLTFVFRQLSNEAEQLADTADKYATGLLDYRGPQPSTAELARLGQALDDMARQLSKRMSELRSQQTEQQAILQSMSNGVIAIDLEQRILNVNQAAERLLGLNADHARGRLLQEAVRHPDLHRFVAAALVSNAAHTAEFKLWGEPRITVQAVSETLIEPDGRPKGLLIILNDVTQLRRLETLRSDFAANVSHELRTPITNIKGYVETLLEVGLDDSDQARKFLEIIRKNSSRLASIVEDVLSLTRLEQPQSKDQIERTPTRLLPLLKAVQGQFEEAADAKHITVTVDAPADLSVPAHSQLLEQAIGNLLSNAINYSPPHTQVDLRAKAVSENRVEVTVADRGSGIAKEHLPRLFERFYRVDKGRSRELGGTGLGLALVKHIAIVHGGNVSVESELDVGSTFRLTLPRHPARSSAERSAPPADIAGVDDHPA